MENNTNTNTNTNTEAKLENTSTVDKVDTTAADGKTYTQEEVNALLQKEADKRVTEALKKAERKKEKAVKEAEKLAAMNEEEKFKYQLEQRELALAEKEKQFALMENKVEASKALNSRGIAVELADLVVAEDADTMMENIKVLENAFKKSVKAEVEKRLSSTTPKKNLGGDYTKEDFMKLPISEQISLANANPKYRQFYE